MINKLVNLRRISELLIVFIIGGILGYWLKPIPDQKMPSTIEIIRDSIIRDSIYVINESIRTEIKYVKEFYTKDSSDIMSANDSVLFDKFSRYIENYNNK